MWSVVCENDWLLLSTFTIMFMCFLALILVEGIFSGSLGTAHHCDYIRIFLAIILLSYACPIHG